MAGLAWVLLIEAFEAARGELADQAWLDVRYEDLLADADGVVGRLLTFYGLDLDAAFRRRLQRYSFTTSRSQAYERDLDVASLKALEDVQGPTLERYGYL